MDKELKLKISLESNNAAADIKKLDGQVSELIKKLTVPIKPDIEFPTLDTISNYNNLKLVIDQLKQSVAIPLHAPLFIPQNVIQSKKERESLGRSNFDGDLNKAAGHTRQKQSSGEDFTTYQKKLTDIERKYSNQRQKISSEEYLKKSAGMKTVFLAAEVLLGRQTALYKSLSMVEATVSVYNAANAALLPPPVGAGPILGEIQAGLVIMNGLKRVEKIATTQIPGYAKGGIVIGEKGPEVIENMQDYAAGRGELVQKTIRAVQKEISGGSNYPNELAGEIKNLRAEIKSILTRPAVAFLDDKQAKKIYYRGNYFARKTR